MENKVKKGYFLSDKTVQQIENNLRASGCKNASEFVTKAIEFYVGYLNAEADSAYLSPAIQSTMKAVVKNTEDRLARIMYKMAVEQAMMMNLFASEMEYDEATLDRLRGRCVKEINSTKGKYSLEDATRFQRSE